MSSEVSEFAALTGRFVLAFVFLAASVPKLLASADFDAALANYRLLPARLVPPVARWLPRFELAAAAALFAGLATTVVGLALAVLLLLFAGAISFNLFRGRRIDCGCSGFTARRTISWPSVGRNLSLAGIAIGIALQGGGSVPTSDLPAALVAAGTGVLAGMLLSEGQRLRGVLG